MADGLTKIIRFDERFPTTGEPTVQVVSAKSMAGIKLASEAGDYIRNVQPVPGKTIVLVLAMSAGETFGPNRNGDAFAEREIPGLIKEDETLPKHYKSFETDAHVFRHHINKDPAKSIGRVLKAFYNWDMHRVELLLELDNEKASDLVAKINAGEYLAVSMGAKIREDRCNICGNAAPTRASYCDHAKYEMNRIYPDGRQSFVWNPSPKLFDISFVVRPADRIGFMMKKVAETAAVESSAELGERVASVQEKMSTLRKLSDIDKIIRGEVVDHKSGTQPIKSFRDAALPGLMAHTPPFDDQAINTLAGVPLPQALSTLGAMGITPTAVEITRIMIRRADPQADLPPHVADSIAASQGPVLDMMASNPAILEAVQNSGLLDLKPEHVNPELAQKLSSWMEKRSNFLEYMERRIFQEPHPSIGNWDKVQVADPTTGRTYETTQGAMDVAQDANMERKLKILAGAGLLTGAAYKGLSALPSGAAFAPLGAAATGLTGLAMARRSDVPEYPSTEGTPSIGDKVTGERWFSTNAPMNAELRKHSSDAMAVALPLASSAAVTAMLAQEYNRRQDAGTLGQQQDKLNKLVEGGGRVAANHPIPMFLSGLAGIGLGTHGLNKIQRLFVKAAEDSVSLGEVDLDGMSYHLGEQLFARLGNG